MRQFTFSAAAMMVFATLLASAPASAIDNHGPNNQSGKCFKAAVGEGKDLQFGHWGDCPQAAKTTVSSTSRQYRRATR
jgi:hypothetical protein